MIETMSIIMVIKIINDTLSIFLKQRSYYNIDSTAVYVWHTMYLRTVK